MYSVEVAVWFTLILQISRPLFIGQEETARWILWFIKCVSLINIK